jgi:predicted ArsR family transcriptional regulator
MTPGPTPSDSDADVLRAVALTPKPFATASDVAPQLAVGRKQARNRLNDLAEQCLLNVETVGSTKVYWLSARGREALAPD